MCDVETVQEQNARQRKERNGSANAFNEWWDKTGSGMSLHKNEDFEEHAKRVSWEAWKAQSSL